MNVHSPARGEGETFEEYRARREQSHALNKEVRRCTSVRSGLTSYIRRLAIKAAGGIRQLKRRQRAQKGL